MSMKILDAVGDMEMWVMGVFIHERRSGTASVTANFARHRPTLAHLLTYRGTKF
jgi:hypothetical protein